MPTTSSPAERGESADLAGDLLRGAEAVAGLLAYSKFGKPPPTPVAACRPSGDSRGSRRRPSSRDPAPDAQRLEWLLTVDQLAEVWQVSPRTIRRMISKNQIPVIRVGRAVRIHPAVVKLG
jgi:excisionase family DNA binding protein